MNKQLFATAREVLSEVFPPVTSRLLHELLGARPDFQKIAEILKLDPMLSATVLNIVNSAFYALPQKATSVERAAVILGTREIGKIAMSAFLIRCTLHQKEDEALFGRWRNTMWTAIVTELIAHECCPEDADILYLCAFFKDISSVLLEVIAAKGLLPQEDGREEQSLTAKLDMTWEKLFGKLNYAQASVTILEHWNIINLGDNCILHQYDVDNIEAYPPMTKALILGTFWGQVVDEGKAAPANISRLEILAAHSLGISAATLEEIRVRSVERFHSILDILEISKIPADKRFYELSGTTLHHFYFQCMEIMEVSGGVENVAKHIERHLRWNFNIGHWELALYSPLSFSWKLFRCDGELTDFSSASEEKELVWGIRSNRYELFDGNEKLGELRFAADFISQEQKLEVNLYSTMLARVYAQYNKSHAARTMKADVLDDLPVGVAYLDTRGSVLGINRALEDLFEVKSCVKGKNLLQCFPFLRIHGREWDNFFKDTSSEKINKIVSFSHCKTEKSCYIHVYARRVGDKIILAVADIFGISTLEAQVFRHKEFLDQVINSMRDIVLTVDYEGIISFAPARLKEHLVGKNLFQVAKPQDNSDVWGPEIFTSRSEAIEVMLRLEDNSSVPMEFMSSPLDTVDANKHSYLVVGRDLTGVRRLEENIKRQAIFDGLTHLYNQRQFYIMLDREVARANRTKRDMALVFLDMNDFKKINDTQGHQAGDKVLKTMGDIINKEARKGSDFPCRYGGDEFAIIVTECTKEGPLLLAGRIHEAMEKAFQGTASASIGIALLRFGESYTSLLARADRAAYMAKVQAGNSIVVAEE